MSDKAIEALLAYGYQQREGGIYRIPNRNTQAWMAVEGGFSRFDPGENGPTPYRGLTPEEAEAEGKLDRLRTHNFREPAHADLFIWVWPADEVERIYAAGLAARTAEPPVEE